MLIAVYPLSQVKVEYLDSHSALFTTEGHRMTKYDPQSLFRDGMHIVFSHASARSSPTLGIPGATTYPIGHTY